MPATTFSVLFLAGLGGIACERIRGSFKAAAGTELSAREVQRRVKRVPTILAQLTSTRTGRAKV
jgi:hypothetical protein